MNELNILVFAPSYPPAFRSGGPARTLAALVVQAPTGILAWVLAPNRDLGNAQKLNVEQWRWLQQKRSRVKYVDTRNWLRVLRHFLATQALKPRIVYLNSLFHPVFTLIPLGLSRLGAWKDATVVLAPRGEMDANALQLRSRQKKIVISLLKLSRIDRRIVWHASNQREADQIRNVWGAGIRVVVREDEVALPSEADSPEFGGSPLRFGFVSRIVPNKGLLEAINAIMALSVEVEFTIHGPVEDEAYFLECKAAASRSASNCKINFAGPIEPDQVRSFFRECDAFIFPTQFENFGHVIAESLSASCPVLAPDTTPWTSILARGGGFVIDPEKDALVNLIKHISSLTPSERLDLRKRAGLAYNEWRSSVRSAHVFQLVLN